MTDTTSDVESIDAASVELEPGGRMLLGVQDPVEGLAATERFANALKAKIEANNLSHRIGGKDYLGLEALQMAATALGIVAVVTETRKLENGWAARAEARTLAGAIVGAGDSQCVRDEHTWSRRADFALLGMAQSRALSRALRGPVGSVVSLASFAVTPAEEMDTTPGEPASEPAPVWAKPADNEQVMRAGRAVVDILKAAGVESPAAQTAVIGKATRARCEGVMPKCVAAALDDVAQVIAASLAPDDEPETA